jgi:enoyl-CoA hydratase
MEIPMSAVILERPADGVAVLRLNRPEQRNAIDDTVRGMLVEYFHAFELSRDVACVIITGGERIFAAGADLHAMSMMRTADIMTSPGEAAYAAIRRFPKPIIAAVNGFALGGGCELAMHADIIVAGETAKFGQPEIKVGIMPGAGGTQRLTRAVGKFKAMKMLLTGEPVGAREAEAMGLVSEVVADAEVLDRALVLAGIIAAMPPIAARQIKRAVLEGADLPLAAALTLERQAFSLLFDTKDQKEGMAAFLEKRLPVFRGE